MRPVDLAREHGLSTQAIRNYEDVGILPAAERTVHGYRTYTPLHAQALRAFLALVPGHGHQTATSIMQAVNRGATQDALRLIDESHGQLLDDRRTLPAAVRLAAHLAAALWALAWLGGLPPLRIGDQLVTLGALGTILGALGIVWVLNLFNFMDGIDGLAASEATFIAWSGAVLAGPVSVGNGAAAAAAVFGASCLGFLRWNWPPARIFMGDVGSGFAGYVIAVLALGTARHDPIGLWTWLVLGGAFFVDATVTLLRRLLRGERAYEAHRSHAYQWLARRWGSHGTVTLAVLTVNILWLLPCAVLANKFPRYAAMLVLIALAPLVPLAIIAGAGRREE